MLHPFMKKKDVQQLLAYLQLPYEMEAEIVHLPKAALRRYVIMGWITSAVLAVPIIGASIYFKQNIALFTLIPLCIIFTLLAYARYTSSGYMIRDNQLVMVYRGLAKYTGIMQKKACSSSRIQSIVFSKKDELCTAVVSVAGHPYKVKHMQKKMRFVYIIGIKKKETPACNSVSFLCRHLSISRYIRKIADIFQVAPIYSENRRYNFTYRGLRTPNP